MKPLLDAIVTYFAGNSPLLAAFPGGLWLDEAEETAGLPRLVMQPGPPTIETLMGPQWQIVPITFVVIAATDTDAQNAMAVLNSWLEGSSYRLTLTGGPIHFNTRKVSGELPRLCEASQIPRDSDAARMWSCEGTWDFAVQE